MSMLKRWISLEGLPRISRRILLLVLGILVLLLRDHLTGMIHIVVGVAIIVITLMMLITTIREKNYDDPKDPRLTMSVIGLILGLMILGHPKQDSIHFIGIAWGLQGLSSGVHELHLAFCAFRRKQKFLVALIHGGIETCLSMMLVFNPLEEISMHVLVLGIEMIIQALEFPALTESTHTS